MFFITLYRGNHEGQQDMDHGDIDAESVEHQLQGFRCYVGPYQNFINDALFLQNDDPGCGSNQQRVQNGNSTRIITRLL